MKYRNAKAFLPQELLCELQKYAQGELIYVPSGAQKARWGAVSGSRSHYEQRNAMIIDRHRQGQPLDALAREFCLTTDSIKKILKSQVDAGEGACNRRDSVLD